MITIGDYEKLEQTTNHLEFIKYISYPQLNELTKKAIRYYGSAEKLQTAYDVCDVLLAMLKRKHQIDDTMEHFPYWVELLIAAAYMHNLFYDGSLPSLFVAREKIAELAKECDIPVNGIAALFQTIEGQLGDNTPVESCIPKDSTPNGLFSWACFFATEYKKDKQLPKSTSYKQQ